MKELIPHILVFILPLFFANTLHMVVVKLNVLNVLAKPISSELFGTGKTYRAFVVLPLFTGLFSLIFQSDSEDLIRVFLLGSVFGFVYLLAELPNSYIKRKMGIGSGETHPQRKVFQRIMDKLDSILVLGITYYFVAEISFKLLTFLLLLSFIIHITFSYLLFRIKLKKNI